MQLIIHTSNTTITVKNKSFFIENETISKIISPKRVSSIAITVNCNINTSAIKLAANNQIPIYFYNNFGTLQARMCSPFLVNLAGLRRKQLYFYDTKLATKWVISILIKKINLQKSLLKQFASRKPRHTQKIAIAISSIDAVLDKLDGLSIKKIDYLRNSLLGFEGSVSKIYFKNLALFVPEKFKFTQRTRQPALDFFNAGLNYLYGMTYSVVESGIYAKGLDPFSGYLHTDNYRKPSLVYDLIEPVRPLIDKMWIQLLLENKINKNHFIKKEQGFWLNKEGKRIIIPTFNNFLHKRFKINNNFYTLKGYIYTLSNELGNMINLSINKD